MPLRIVLSQFWRDIRAQRLRTGLTLFGLAWGTFCVVVLLSFGEGLQRKQVERGAAMGERIILLWGSRTSIPFEGLPRGRYIPLRDSDADAITREVPGVVDVSPEYGLSVSLRGPAGQAAGQLSGVRPGFGAMRRIEAEPGGRFISERDERERRRVAVIGARVRRDLFGEAPAVGQTVTLQGVPFLVIGTMARKDQDSNYNGPDDWKVFIPSSVARASLGQTHPDNLVIQVEGNASSSQVVRDVRAVLGRIHHYDPKDEEALSVWDVGDMIKTFLTIFVGFKIFLALLGTLTLAVAGIGVANTMSMVVEDRTTQIGISMALGARRGWVLSQILLETICFTTIGGGLGVLLATGVVSAARFLPLENSIGTPVFSWPIAILTAGLIALIGILSGMGPARRAAYLNPAEALRG